MSTTPAVDEKRRTFFATLGECITIWSAIEREAFELFHQALGADREKSALVFWSIPTFGMRLSYTSMLVTHCLKSAAGEETRPQSAWKSISASIKTLYTFRNRLAH